jgi:NAD(P)-dependent dehydrogenase (short-subunit alcohol dehydrogenase family)
MPTVLITGANRGIGLEFARQYADDGWRVIATCREPSRAAALAATGAEIHTLDVTDHAGVQALGRALAGETIDLFISNAGVYLDKGRALDEIEPAVWQESFAVNSMAPLVCANTILPLVARSSERKMIAIGSIAGAITQIRYGGAVAYRASKAALHLGWRVLAHDHPEIIAAILSPSRVRTDMNPEAPLAADVSVAGMRQIIARLTPQDSGGFFRYDGMIAPW